MVELILLAPQEVAERVCDLLGDELEALSVSVEDADADTEAEQPHFGEPGMAEVPNAWTRSTLRALFDDADAAERAATLLLAQDWTDGLRVQAVQAVADQDWVRLTQSQFEPVGITPSFWVVPSWHEAPASATRVIRLDPGLAFGTGTHPTTRMCLRWIATHADVVARSERVLDYGCGSGILAIATALHGAARVEAVDIDAAAVTATGDNARANGVSLVASMPDSVSGHYGVVLANILASPLKLLAPLLCSHLAPGGHLVLAGILSRQTEELQAAYAPWLALEAGDEEEGWVLLHGTRAAGA